ncbi:MAG: glyoxalase [Xanthomonadales bacterium]|nr:glyoxalase [Xanthomonadales bacterium]
MKLDHMLILLSDLANHIGFYDALLPMMGFEKQRDHVFANDDGVHLDFRAAEDPDHEYRRFSPGLNHLGFTAPNLDVLEKLRAEMSRKGFMVPDIQQFEDGHAIFFKDPEGMRIEVGYYA